MIMPVEAIEKALSGGWNAKYTVLPLAHAVNHWHEIALDPSFWKGLGKALGWEDCKCTGRCGSVYPEYVNGCVRCGESVRADEHYLFHSLKFARLILTGGDTDAFWKELLT